MVKPSLKLVCLVAILAVVALGFQSVQAEPEYEEEGECIVNLDCEEFETSQYDCYGECVEYHCEDGVCYCECVSPDRKVALISLRNKNVVAAAAASRDDKKP